MKRILFYSLLIFFSQQSFSQQLDSLIMKGIKEIYNLQFSDADKTFKEIIADYPEHPSGRFFLAMIDWWRILVDLDVTTYDDIFFQKLEDVIFQCDEILKKDENNLDALFFKGGAIGFRGRLRAIRESWLKAADDGRSALPIVQKAFKIDPTNSDIQLGFGIYNYYADVIPSRYPLLKPIMLFFPSGNKTQGIRQLVETSLTGKYAKYEAQYFLMTLYYTYEEDFDKADEYASKLYSIFPNNPVFERWKGRIAVRKGNLYEYFNIFSSVYNKCQDGLTGYNQKAKREAAYYIGLFYKVNGNADSSLVYFSECLALSESFEKEPSGFLINSLLYVSMMNDALGKRNDAVAGYKRILDMKEYSGSHYYARLHLEKPFTF